MSNGGHICCEYCSYNRSPYGQCDIFGIETNPFILCRSFRKAGQSHSQARKEWPMLNDLRPGLVYQIDNSIYCIHKPKPIYYLKPIGDDEG